VLSVRRAADMLIVVIRDRGPGIPPEVMERVGEPFFTTKAPGRGMGLGLFLARAVVEGVGGSMQIDSTEAGTEVRVQLPTDVAGAGARQIVAPTSPRESQTMRMVSKPI